ncbi:DUF3244 domain-containing protein [Prevotella sp.]|uniref:DUF3244 domain-containing protein n=1 Tax=Prevotella sp. TaxID=59823 RepID=UPI00307CA101
MKKKVIISLMIFSGIALYAKDKIVIHSVGGYGHLNPYEIPTVTSDGDDVTIKSDSTITDMTVVIRDQYGNVMHQSTQTVGPAETTLYVPNTDGDSEKTTIDLYYDRRHLSGTFDE